MLYVSLPEKDALSAPIKHFSVHGDVIHPKIKLAQTPAHFGSLSYTFTSNPITNPSPPRDALNLFTLAHGYPYKPMVFGTCRRTSTGQQFGLPATGLFGTASQGFTLWVDGVNILIEYYNLGFGGEINVNGETFVFTYYIFAENGSL